MLLAAFAVVMLGLFWLLWTFGDSEAFDRCFRLGLVALLVLQIAAQLWEKRRKVEPEAPAVLATKVPVEVLVEWDDPLPNQRPHDLDATADPDGGLFTEGFTPDVPVRPTVRSHRRR